MIDEMCQRYGVLPSELLKEDARALLRLRAILAEASHE